MMAYNILYARDDNGLSLQQGAGWDCNPTISGELGRENDSQEAERYPEKSEQIKNTRGRNIRENRGAARTANYQKLP